VEPTVVGTYDLTYGPDHITGSFGVNYCTNVDVEGSGSGGAPVCEK
jgi:hypothetical protein